MVTWAVNRWEQLIGFFETGGNVLIPIFVVTVLMWVLIIERYIYFARYYNAEAIKLKAVWLKRPERDSWHAHKFEIQMISEIRQKLNQGIPMINTFIALCPLLGLLGTVTGMIEVFDVMAIAGGGNPRAMASGVSRATIPTMAGMVAALSGIYFAAQLRRRAHDELREFEDHLR